MVNAANSTDIALRMTLINPPFSHFPGLKKNTERYTRPPLGIAYLAAYLKKYYSDPIEIRLIDCEVENLHEKRDICRAILNTKPHIIGFSVVTGTFNITSELALDIKACAPDIITIAGGPHITALPEEAMPGIDVKIFGEGEKSLLEYIQSDLRQSKIRDIAGCIQFQKGEILSIGDPRPFIENLDSIPMPARELLKSGAYFHTYPYSNVRDFTTMFTSRGCPYNCNFCGNKTIWGGNVRFHSIDRTCEEIDDIVKRGINLIFFDDDTFTLNKRRIESICSHIRDNHPDLQWICHVRADTVNAGILSKMKRSGCVEVQIGVESGDPEVLAKTDKLLNVEQIRSAFDHLHEIGLNSWATFVFGGDSETKKTIRASIDFAKQIDPTYCSFIVLLPFPGTSIFEKYKKLNFITTFDWSRYSWHGRPVIQTDSLSTDELIAWRRKANIEFFLRPKKLFSALLTAVRSMSWREMLRNFRAWQALIRQK